MPVTFRVNTMDDIVLFLKNTLHATAFDPADSTHTPDSDKLKSMIYPLVLQPLYSREVRKIHYC